MRQLLPLAGLLALAAGPAQAQTDPAGSSPILAALNWVQNTLLGNVATSAAVIAVAAVGFLMLTGRIEWKRGLTVIVGAFIIFGAVTIVAGIRSLAGG
jgi:type IV secretory pathway VirB2 component (pilin)